LPKMSVKSGRNTGFAVGQSVLGQPPRNLCGAQAAQARLSLSWMARENKHVALLFIDLDRFKQINGTLCMTRVTSC
ncbi:MAG: hypothetical protein V7629_20030, partial [Motiliproteus sp.]